MPSDVSPLASFLPQGGTAALEALGMPRMVMGLPHHYQLYMGHHSPFVWETILYATARTGWRW